MSRLLLGVGVVTEATDVSDSATAVRSFVRQWQCLLVMLSVSLSTKTTTTTTTSTTNHGFYNNHTADCGGVWPALICRILLLILLTILLAGTHPTVTEGAKTTMMPLQQQKKTANLESATDDDLYAVDLWGQRNDTIPADAAEDEKGRRLSLAQVSNVSASVRLRSRLRSVDSAPRDHQLPCTDTAWVVHQLTPTWPRIYAEYHAAQHPGMHRHPVGGASTTLCLERRFHWTGFVEEEGRDEHPAEVVTTPAACAPEVENLVVGMNATSAAYLALYGGLESLASGLRCVPLERLPVHVVTVECSDDVTSDDVTYGRAVTEDRSVKTRLGVLNHVVVDQLRCRDVMSERGWRLHAKTKREFVFVRQQRHRDVIRRRRHSSRDLQPRGLTDF